MLELPTRTSKPRQSGLTCWTDTGLTIAQASALLEDYGDYVDVVKLGVGSAFVTPRLREKVAMYKSAGVKLYFGGTLFEKFYSQDKLEDYKRFLASHDMEHAEISSGTIDMSMEQSVEVLTDMSKDFTCFCEVGTKDKSADLSPDIWISWMQTFLDSGAEYVIAEGRDSGTAGIFHPTGDLRKDLIQIILKNIDPERIIFEAPTSIPQMHFINVVGANVNLGNVKPQDTLLLESQRQSLRYETFFLK